MGKSYERDLVLDVVGFSIGGVTLVRKRQVSPNFSAGASTKICLLTLSFAQEPGQ